MQSQWTTLAQNFAMKIRTFVTMRSIAVNLSVSVSSNGWRLLCIRYRYVI